MEFDRTTTKAAVKPADNFAAKFASGAFLAMALISAPVFATSAFAGPAKVKTIVVAPEFRATEGGAAVTYPASLGADIQAAIASRLTDKGLITKGSGAKLRIALKDIRLEGDAGQDEARLSAYVREGYRQQSSKSGISYHSFWPTVVVRGDAGYQALVDGFADAVVAHISK